MGREAQWEMEGEDEEDGKWGRTQYLWSHDQLLLILWGSDKGPLQILNQVEMGAGTIRHSPRRDRPLL